MKAQFKTLQIQTQKMISKSEFQIGGGALALVLVILIATKRIRHARLRPKELEAKGWISPRFSVKRMPDGSEKQVARLNHVRFRKTKDRIEIWPVNPTKTLDDARNDLHWFSELYSTKFAEVKKSTHGLLRRFDKLTLYFERFPAVISWPQACPQLKSHDVYLGVDAFGKHSAINTKEASFFTVLGSMGSGKTVALNAVIASFLKSNPETRFVIGSSKPHQDFGAYSDDPRFKLFNPSHDEHLSVLIEEVKSIRNEINRRSEVIRAAKKKHAADVPGLAPIVLILDEARTYLSAAAAKASKERTELVKSAVAEIDNVIRLGRFASVVTVVGSQGDTVDEIDVNVKLAQTMLLSRSGTKQQSQNLIGSDLAYDPSLTGGLFILKSQQGVGRIKVAMFDPDRDFSPRQLTQPIDSGMTPEENQTSPSAQEGPGKV